MVSPVPAAPFTLSDGATLALASDGTIALKLVTGGVIQVIGLTAEAGSGQLAVFDDNDGTDVTAVQKQAVFTSTDGVLKAGFTAASGLLVAVNSAPADAALAPGRAALWFDQTNGAAKLMIKAKQADGTVKTGSVNVVT